MRLLLFIGYLDQSWYSGISDVSRSWKQLIIVWYCGIRSEEGHVVTEYLVTDQLRLDESICNQPVPILSVGLDVS